MMLLKRSTAAAVCALLLAFPASAQVIGSGHVIGNGTGSLAAPTDTPLIQVMNQSGSGLGSGVATALGVAAGASGGFIPTTGTMTPGDCVSVATGPKLVDAGIACGGGTKAFLHSKDFGATGNGTTNDTAALQSWVAACQTSGQVCWLDPGTYKTITALSVTDSVIIDAPNFISSAIVPAVGIDAIDINTASPVFMYHFGIAYPSAASSGTTGISVTAPSGQENSASVFRDIRILSPFNGMHFIKASVFTADDVKIELFGNDSYIIENQNRPDSGDSTITSGFLLGNGSSNACVFWESSGGLKFIGNKCVTTANGFQVSASPGISTSQLIITGNSFDGMTSSGFIASRQSTTGALTEVLFNDNTCSSVTICINIPADATSGAWLSNLQVSGNTWISNAGSDLFASLGAGAGVNITNNTLQNMGATTAQAFNCASGATSVVFGIFVKTGTFIANSNACGATAITPN